MNSIANGLDRELGGEWERFTSAEPGERGAAHLVNRHGKVVYSFDSDWWWVEASGESVEAHRALVAGFLAALPGVPADEAQAAAASVVAARVPAGSTHQGPRSLEFFTYKGNKGWTTFFIPVLHESYEHMS